MAAAATDIPEDVRLAPAVTEFLGHVDRSRALGHPAGIVVLACPESDSVEIVDTVPLEHIFCSARPATTIVQALQGILSPKLDAAPAFAFIRRPVSSNTPDWILVSWAPESLNKAHVFLAARIRSMILSSLREETLFTVLCTSRTDLPQLEAVLRSTQPAPPPSGLMTNGMLRQMDIDACMLPKADYLAELPLRLAGSCEDNLRAIGPLENGSGLVLTIVQTNGLVLLERSFAFHDATELSSVSSPVEPRYLLTRFDDVTTLILRVPEPRTAGPPSLLSFCQPSVRRLLETFGIPIDRAADLRGQEPPGGWLFQPPVAPHMVEHVLLRAEALKRPRPPVRQLSRDPFLKINSTVSPDGTVSYMFVGASDRFKFV